MTSNEVNFTVYHKLYWRQYS